MGVEHSGHEMRMTHRHTKPQSVNFRHPIYFPDQLLDDHARPSIISCQQLTQRLGVIATTAPPWNLSEIGSICNAVVGKRHQSLLVDRIP